MPALHAKRRLSSAPARPSSRKTSKEDAATLAFVVQKHAASHLHYDLRLELDGKFLSWAVPKGPSMNPNDKRLAMRVEDHDLTHESYEGVIPSDHEGAGAVIVWDRGSYGVAPQADPKDTQRLVREGLAAGKLVVVLHGEKLKGEFLLLRLPRAGERAWLFIKLDDEHSTRDNLLAQDRSVLSGRTIEDVQRGVMV